MFVTDANGRFFAPYLTPGKYAVKVELSGFSRRRTEEHRRPPRAAARSREPHSQGRRPDGGRRGRGRRADGRHVFDHDGRGPRLREPQPSADRPQLHRHPLPRARRQRQLGPGQGEPLHRRRPAAWRTTTSSTASTSRTRASERIGAYNSTFGSLGSGVTTDFIKETQVKTGGFEAEYGQATGGVVNVVTKSGENAFHGIRLRLHAAVRTRSGLEDAPGPERNREHGRPSGFRRRPVDGWAAS